MARFGEKLKAAREERGVTLDAIALKTRVSVRLLGAIESERFDLLPGGVFNISFIRQYCRAIGLDEEEIVAEFNQLARPAELDVAEQVGITDDRVLMQERGATLAENVTDYLRHYGRVTAAALSVLLVVIALAWFFPGSQPSSEPASDAATAAQTSPPAASASEVTAPVAEPEPTSPPAIGEPDPGPPLLAGAASAVEPAAGSSDETATARASASDATKPLHVEISITAKVWVQAVADGVRVFEDILEPGATRLIEASDSVRLVVGNAAGVTVALNGKVLPPIGPSGHVRRVVLTSSGMEIDRVEPNRPAGETASDSPFETRNGSRSVPALATARPER